MSFSRNLAGIPATSSRLLPEIGVLKVFIIQAFFQTNWTFCEIDFIELNILEKMANYTSGAKLNISLVSYCYPAEPVLHLGDELPTSQLLLDLQPPANQRLCGHFTRSERMSEFHTQVSSTCVRISGISVNVIEAIFRRSEKPVLITISTSSLRGDGLTTSTTHTKNNIFHSINWYYVTPQSVNCPCSQLTVSQSPSATAFRSRKSPAEGPCAP